MLDRKYKIKVKRKDLPIILLLLVAFILRIGVLITKGPMFGLNSDDVSYVNSAITFV